MKESLLDILCCPLDKHDLELEDPVYESQAGGDELDGDDEAAPEESDSDAEPTDEADDGDAEITSGTLVCSECDEHYPIEDGIPNLLPPDMREETPA